jgi:high-affinity iron transporter
MLTSLLITLREGIEASLLMGIIIAYLAKTGKGHLIKYAWLGAGAAFVVSLLAGAAIYLTAGELSGIAEQLYEGSAVLVAAGILTWMIFLMKREAANVKSGLQSRIASSAKDSWFGLAALAFVAIVREGIETVLFLFASSRTAGSTVSATFGAVIGLVIAFAIGYVLYRGTTRLNLRVFFNITSIVLIVFAAGMVSHGLHEFIEAGIVPGLITPLWNTGAVLSDESGAGRLLASLFGYSSDPSLIEVLGWVAYLGGTLTAYFRTDRAPRGAKT